MGARWAELPPWTQPLRIWQHRAVIAWAQARPARSLAIVCPGAGKTLYAAAVAYGALVDELIEQIIVVVPSDHLRTQAALAFAEIGLQLDPTFSNSTPSLARDLCGAVVSYQQVGQDPEVFRELTSGSVRRPRRSLVVLDEVHHAGEHERWGQGIQRAFAAATYILALSGTPFRSDDARVAFVPYDRDGRVTADTLYGYREALRDDIVRPLVFYRQGGTVEWTDRASGTVDRRSFDEPLSESSSRQRLRAALRDAGWVSSVLERANAVLESLRRGEADAAGLIVAVNERHARWIANLMQRELGIYPVVVTYVDAGAGEKIRKFRNGRAPWLVAVRMVSEGVDIPRARVMVYLTTILTQMFFLQMAGRVVRVRDGVAAPGYVLFPDDPVLRAWALAIEDDVHAVQRADPWRVDVLCVDGADVPYYGTPTDAAAATDTSGAGHCDGAEIVHEPSVTTAVFPSQPTAAVIRVAAASPTPVRHDLFEAASSSRPSAHEPQLLANEKQALRQECNRLAKAVSQRFRVEIRAVHAALQRRDRVSVREATALQLRRRLRSMEIWLEQGFFPK